mmetsp:Transcript_11611/g.31648  ORF Transcript_11611/g.31648 Transcript_11611/m.31648 type:complete len:200 (-) Transcript_11611:6514-7113(-)
MWDGSPWWTHGLRSWRQQSTARCSPRYSAATWTLPWSSAAATSSSWCHCQRSTKSRLSARSWKASCPRSLFGEHLPRTRSSWSTTLCLPASGPLAAVCWWTRFMTTAPNSPSGGSASGRTCNSLRRAWCMTTMWMRPSALWCPGRTRCPSSSTSQATLAPSLCPPWRPRASRTSWTPSSTTSTTSCLWATRELARLRSW